MPFTAETAELLSLYKPPVVSFHFGLPSADLLERVRSWGARILSSATTVEEAIWLEAHGVDGVIAQGLEAGGHRGIFLSDDLSTQMGIDIPEEVQCLPTKS
jgi:nitronate monooxygenase